MRSIRCSLDNDGCIDLLAVLKVMNQIDQEQAWAIAYELGKLMQRRGATNCAPIDNLAQVHLHSKGYVHDKSVKPGELADKPKRKPKRSSQNFEMKPKDAPGSPKEVAAQQQQQQHITSSTTTVRCQNHHRHHRRHQSDTTIRTASEDPNTTLPTPPITPEMDLRCRIDASDASSDRTSCGGSDVEDEDEDEDLVAMDDATTKTDAEPAADATDDETTGCRSAAPNETELVASLGIALFWALDFGIPDDEERKLSISMEYLIYQSQTKLSLKELLDICIRRLSIATKTQADTHYRNICKSLVYDAIELSLFLDKIYTATMVLSDIKKQNNNNNSTKSSSSSSSSTTSSSASSSPSMVNDHIILVDDDDILELGEPLASLRALRINDWARLWMQVIRELRQRGKFKQQALAAATAVVG